MKPRKRILCINRRNNHDSDKKIDFLGGMDPNGLRWVVTPERAIRDIRLKTCLYFIMVDGQEVEITVHGETAETQYLKAQVDFSETNWLLTLPECQHTSIML